MNSHRLFAGALPIESPEGEEWLEVASVVYVRECERWKRENPGEPFRPI